MISHIISHFKIRLEEEAGEEINSILVGRPVNFHDSDEKLDKLAENRLREAFSKAGFINIEFQYEPIGAFNAYANKHRELKTKNNKVLVVDLGGGTSDFSIFDINEKGLEVLGNNGIYIGGDNIDEKLIFSHYSKSLGKGSKKKLMNGSITDIPSNVYSEFADKSKLLFFKENEDLARGLLPLLVNQDDKIPLGRLIEVFGDPGIGYSFHSQVENGKILLTSKEQVLLDFNMFKSSFSDSLNRSQFNEIINLEVQKIRQALIETINISGLKASDISKIIMNGGTAYIPIIQMMVEDILGKGKILKGNTLSSVGYGLTLESYEKFM